MFQNSSMRPKHQQHWFHMVEPSPWPFTAAWVVFGLAVSLVGFMHRLTSVAFLIGFIFLLGLVAQRWFSDVVEEADSGYHTEVVQAMLRFGFLLFIASEVMLFFSFFWALFHSAFAPSVWIGTTWPPDGIDTVSWVGAPLANTFLLLASSLAVTLSHSILVTADYYSPIWVARAVPPTPEEEAADFNEAQDQKLFYLRSYFHFGQHPDEFLNSGSTGNDEIWFPRWVEVSSGLRTAIYLGFFFLFFQFMEYSNAGFSISDSVYGSVFYMLTGLHGFHVLVGVLFLSFCLFRSQLRGAFSKDHHVAFECAAWYWHFVDVVWLLLFFVVYYLLG